MRRLPVYLLLDTSGSMYGEPIESVKNGLQTLLSSLRQDPYALETAFLSIIEFNTKAIQSVPLTDLMSFQSPDLIPSGTTSLGAALTLLASKVNEEVKTTTLDEKGDWRPLVFVFSDGGATDDFQKGIDDLKATQMGIVVACAAGHHAKIDELSKITENVVHLENADSNAISAFFEWVSASISTNSQKVENGESEASQLSDLPPPPPEINLVDLTKK
ncbi:MULTISPECIES: VWA domain-containing protein [Pseudoalteromonas]|uniref:VWA domain-containing protein n=1 Tax=Pseudoalteromonas TaxID=53246 RepID=UPI0025B4F506|nr:VWA domain-containing protein [Pseudoalteromonas sp. APC 3691]MDN3390347.1 VWA domain-containing protein [Pseudoalteromonas sp. APC 3691]